jgi:hypothetical protein
MDAKQPPARKRKGQEEVRAQMPDERRAELLNKLALGLADRLKKAVSARQASGIEKVWTEDEEFYQGMDDANRHEFAHVITKPSEGGRDTKLKEHKGSTLFPNITAPYVDAAAAKIADMLLPTDDRNFVVEPTPVPDILDEEEGFDAAVPAAPMPGDQLQQPAGDPQAEQFAQQMLAGQAGGAPQPGMPQTPGAMAGAPAAPAAPQDPIKAMLLKLETIRQKATDAAERAQDKIDDFLVECGYHTELRQVIHDAARLGTGVLKGPIPRKTKVQVWAKDPATGERVLVVKEEVKPVSVRVDPWNLFPDASCGDNIHRGSSLWERDFLTSKQLADLKKAPGAAKHFDHVIDKVIAEGPKKNNNGANRGMHQGTEVAEDEFEVWYFYGEITAEDLEAVGCECEDKKARYPVLITMVNDLVIKAALNPLDNGEFPFDVLAWKTRPGMPWGTGVARQARVGQRIVVAGTRNLMDNAGASARPHKVITDAIEPGGDPWTWRVNPDSGNDVRTAMNFFVQPSLQAELAAIIQMGEKMVELHTGLPMIILGMQGNVEETAHGRALQNNNGSMVMRRLAKQFDGGITEPHIRRYHTWLMLYSEDDALKGDMVVRARGSAALVERDLQNQQLPTVMSLSLNPAFKMDPELAAEEYLKSQRFDPKAFKMTEEKLQKAAQNAQPPVLPQVEAAKVREAGAMQRLQLQQQHEAQQNDLDRQIEQMALTIEAQLGSAALGTQERLALDDIKATLAGITLKLRTQKELSALAKGTQALHPPTEPAGRAADGKAFVQ